MAIRKTQGIGAALSLALLAACAQAPTPAWRSEAHSALGRYENLFMRGEIRLAQLNFERALKEVSATGDFTQVNRVQLARCALETGVLEFTPCPGYHAQAADPAQQAYLRFLGGSWSDDDVALLPVQYRKFAATARQSAQPVNQTIAEIASPLSRLVAVGVAVERRQFDGATLELATDTASREGWRRPLLVYLGQLKTIAEAKGDMEKARQLQERLDLVLDSLKDER